MSLFTAGYVGLLVLSAVIAGRLAEYAWRRRGEPGARPFAGLMAAVALWGVCTAATTVAHDTRLHLLIEQGQWAATMFVPVFWILFTLTYTGHDELITGPTVLLLSVIPAVTLVLGVTNPLHGLVWAESHVYVAGGIAVASRLPGEWYWVFVTYAYALIGIGTLLVLRLALVSKYLFTDQSVLLVVGTVVPLAANAVSITEATPLPGIDVTPIAFTATGLSFGYALFRRRLFELVPATRRLGRDTAIATLDDGILILDNNDHVIYLNPAAADVLDCVPERALGVPAADLLDTSAIEFDVSDAPAELHIGDRYYEASPSAVTDRRDHEIGQTLVLHDVTARTHREHRLRRQRDELERLDRLNEAVRETTRAFVSATSRTAIEDAVRTRLSAPDLYAEASIVVDTGDEIVAGDGGTRTGGTGTPIVVPGPRIDGESFPAAVSDAFDTDHGSWAVVPLGYGQAIYGALVLYTTRPDAFGSRERVVLDGFGETVSQAINAVENQRLLLADTVVELEFRCPDAALAAVARAADCGLSLAGLVAANDGEVLVYCHTDAPKRIVDAAARIDGIADTRVVDGGDGVVEFTLTRRSALLALAGGGTNVRTATAGDNAYRVVVEVAPETDVRALTERVREHCPGTTLAAKRDRNRPTETGRHEPTVPETTLGELTDRQHEVLEAAYRAGYFRWPRDRTAEEVADAIGISSPTLHKHLRRAEERLLDEVFDANDETRRPRNRE